MLYMFSRVIINNNSDHLKLKLGKIDIAPKPNLFLCGIGVGVSWLLITRMQVGAIRKLGLDSVTLQSLMLNVGTHFLGVI